MKIVHVVTGLTRANGVSVFLCELAAEQVSLGHGVTVLVKNLTDDHYPAQDDILVIRDQPQDYAAYDVVHIHALWDPWLTRQAKAAKQAGCKVVWSPHGMLTWWALKNKWWKKFTALALYQYWALRSADLIHVTAESEAKDVRRLKLTNSLVVAPLGVRVEEERSGKCKDGPRTLLFVSRIQRKKGLPNLLEAWARLKRDGKTRGVDGRGWTIRIVGPDQEGHLEELKAQTSRLGLTDDVTFCGPKYGADLAQEYALADLFVLPTYSENFGSVVVEALAHALPVLCTRGAPWSELEKYGCGWWIDIGIDPLANALSGALETSDARLKEMGEKGLALVRSRYAWSAVAAKITAEYDRICGKG